MPIHFEADHPFLYFILSDTFKSMPVFSGRLQCPTADCSDTYNHDEL